jgi:hypothetical protein
MDFESVPIVRGRNKRGGTVHDYFSCFDSEPIVSKQLAAAIYFEFNEFCDSIDAGRNTYAVVRDWTRRWSKWSVVRVWPGYFHKRSVMASCAEIAGIEKDPYITVEELQAQVEVLKETVAIAEVEKVDVKEQSTDSKVDILDTKIEVAKDLIKEKEAKIEEIKIV